MTFKIVLLFLKFLFFKLPSLKKCVAILQTPTGRQEDPSGSKVNPM